MKVRDIMSTSTKTVTVDTPLREVVSSMCLYRMSGLPVLDGENLVGFIAEKDVLSKIFPTLEDSMNTMMAVDFEEVEEDYSGVLNLQVGDIMTTKVLSVAPDVPILRATSTMAMYRFRRIPVTEGDKLVGMLSLGDVHKALFKKYIADKITN